MAQLQSTSITGSLELTGIFSGTAYSTITPLDSSSATASVDFESAQVFTIELQQDTLLEFSNTQIGMVKDLIVTGSHSLSLPAGSTAAGEYDGTLNNLVQVLVVDTDTYWYSFSQPQ